MAFMTSIDRSRISEACKLYVRTLEFLDLGRKEWANVDQLDRGIVFADRQGCLVQTAWYVGGDRRVTSRRRHFGSLQHGEMPRWCGDRSWAWGSTTACCGKRSTLSTFKASGAAIDVAVSPRLFFSGVEWMGSVDAVFGIFVEWKVATACTSDRQCQPLITVPCRLPTPPLRLVEPQAGEGY